MFYKAFLSFLLFFAISYACTMDCKSCHPAFDIEQEQHKELKVCYTCHEDNKLENIDMGAACGADCFSCHPVEKLNSLGVAEHKIMSKCQQCHLDSNLRENTSQISSDFKAIKDILGK